VYDQADVGVVEAGAERSRGDDIRLVCGGEPRSQQLLLLFGRAYIGRVLRAAEQLG
jgi:hypothetical protein